MIKNISSGIRVLALFSRVPPFRSVILFFSFFYRAPNDLYAVATVDFHSNRFPVCTLLYDGGGDSRDRYQVFKQFKGAPRTTKITYIVGAH